MSGKKTSKKDKKEKEREKSKRTEKNDEPSSSSRNRTPPAVAAENKQPTQSQPETEPPRDKSPDSKNVFSPAAPRKRESVQSDTASLSQELPDFTHEDELPENKERKTSAQDVHVIPDSPEPIPEQPDISVLEESRPNYYRDSQHQTNVEDPPGLQRNNINTNEFFKEFVDMAKRNAILEYQKETGFNMNNDQSWSSNWSSGWNVQGYPYFQQGTYQNHHHHQPQELTRGRPILRTATQAAERVRADRHIEEEANKMDSTLRKIFEAHGAPPKLLANLVRNGIKDIDNFISAYRDDVNKVLLSELLTATFDIPDDRRSWATKLTIILDELKTKKREVDEVEKSEKKASGSHLSAEQYKEMTDLFQLHSRTYIPEQMAPTHALLYMIMKYWDHKYVMILPGECKNNNITDTGYNRNTTTPEEDSKGHQKYRGKDSIHLLTRIQTIMIAFFTVAVHKNPENPEVTWADCMSYVAFLQRYFSWDSSWAASHVIVRIDYQLRSVWHNGNKARTLSEYIREQVENTDVNKAAFIQRVKEEESWYKRGHPSVKDTHERTSPYSRPNSSPAPSTKSTKGNGKGGKDNRGKGINRRPSTGSYNQNNWENKTTNNDWGNQNQNQSWGSSDWNSNTQNNEDWSNSWSKTRQNNAKLSICMSWYRGEECRKGKNGTCFKSHSEEERQAAEAAEFARHNNKGGKR